MRAKFQNTHWTIPTHFASLGLVTVITCICAYRRTLGVMTLELASLGLALWLGPGVVAAQSDVHPIVVESPTIAAGETMPRMYTPDGRNLSPPLTWKDLPEGTRQLAVVCADFGAGNPPPWVHWIIYGIPATASGLPEGLPIISGQAMPDEISGAIQGHNGWRRLHRLRPR